MGAIGRAIHRFLFDAGLPETDENDTVATGPVAANDDDELEEAREPAGLYYRDFYDEDEPTVFSADVEFKKLTDTAIIPSYGSAGAAGLDLSADVKQPIVLHPGDRALVPTGIAVKLPASSVGLVCPRSGLALNHGITVLNGPGVIDEDYRGELKAMLINLGDEPFTVTYGMRVAQLVITPYARAKWRVVESLDETERGEGGFGSTGLQA